jgi:hypothetical protein
MKRRLCLVSLLATAALRLTAAAPAPAGAPPPLPDGPRVIVYERPNFRGSSLEIEIGTVFENLRYARFSDGSQINDRISSIQIEPGAAIRLWVDDRYRGEPITFLRSVENLTDLTRGGGATWNDTVSALRVEENTLRGRPSSWRDPSRQPRVILFQHPNFGGESFEVFLGESIEDLKGSNFDESRRIVNDEVSSIRVIGQLRVRVHNEKRFRGDSVEITADVADLRTLKRGADGKVTWDDCISAIIVDRVEDARGENGSGERNGQDPAPKPKPHGGG